MNNVLYSNLTFLIFNLLSITYKTFPKQQYYSSNPHEQLKYCICFCCFSHFAFHLPLPLSLSFSLWCSLSSTHSSSSLIFFQIGGRFLRKSDLVKMPENQCLRVLKNSLMLLKLWDLKA